MAQIIDLDHSCLVVFESVSLNNGTKVTFDLDQMAEKLGSEESKDETDDNAEEEEEEEWL